MAIKEIMSDVFDIILKINGANSHNDGSYEAKNLDIEGLTNELHNKWVFLSSEIETLQSENKRLKERIKELEDIYLGQIRVIARSRITHKEKVIRMVTLAEQALKK